MTSGRYWDGRNVHLFHNGDHRFRETPEKRTIRLGLTPDAARELALALSSLKQNRGPLTGDMQELLNALDYVMVGDPNSSREHRRMEAGKGMTPDGGERSPITGGPRGERFGKPTGERYS